VQEPEAGPAMSRYSRMTPAAKRIWGIGLIVFFLIMCGSIAFSQWWAYHVNVPAYEHAGHRK
jgi:hypothetical protein